MNRRGFLKAAGGLAVAAPVAAAAPQAGAMLGGEWMGAPGVGAGLGASGAVTIAGYSMAPAAVQALHAAYRRLSKCEGQRERWDELYRQHRIRVRRGREERKPARLLWLLDERRRLATVRQFNGTLRLPRASRKNRIIYARVRRLMKAAGFPGLPWEMAYVAD